MIRGFDRFEPTPPICGVYLLVAAGVVVYVGQSEDVENRIETHRSDARLVFDDIFVKRLAVADLDAYEGAIIRALRPSHNRTAPAAADRDASVLAELGIAPNKDARPAGRTSALEMAAVLRAARARTGKNQRVVAKEIGISHACVSHYETGQVMPRNIPLIARVYGIPEDDLVAVYMREQARRAE